MPGTSGNLSVRLDRERLLASPTGACKCLLRSADMVLVDLEGRYLAGARGVTSEIGMHLAIFPAERRYWCGYSLASAYSDGLRLRRTFTG